MWCGVLPAMGTKMEVFENIVCDRIDAVYYWSEGGNWFGDFGQSTNTRDGFSLKVALSCAKEAAGWCIAGSLMLI